MSSSVPFGETGFGIRSMTSIQLCPRRATGRSNRRAALAAEFRRRLVESLAFLAANLDLGGRGVEPVTDFLDHVNLRQSVLRHAAGHPAPGLHVLTRFFRVEDYATAGPPLGADIHHEAA